MRIAAPWLLLLLPALFACGEAGPTSIAEPAEMTAAPVASDVPAFVGEDGIAIPEPHGLASRRTRAMARVLNRAVQNWAADADGFFPSHLGHRNALDKSLIDYLPQGRLMMNQFTFANTEPVDGAAASHGQIGYTVVVHEGERSGYNITAIGDDDRHVYEITLEPY